MHILLGIVLALFFVVLFVWLSAHWFGRVMAFVLFAVPCYVLALWLIAQVVPDPPVAFVFALVGLVLAWLLASIPIYILRYQVAKHLAPAELISTGPQPPPYHPFLIERQQRW